MTDTLDKLPCDVQDVAVKDVPKTLADVSKATETLTQKLTVPFALCVGYIFCLRLMLKESGSIGLPEVFSEQLSITVPIVATVGYLCFVYLGKKYMEDKEPYDIKNYMVAYNLYQALLNTWSIATTIGALRTAGMSIWGNQPDYTTNGYQISFLIWLHYNNKYVELLDTVFMVLRKKNKQISFLHCYHHTLLIWSWFCVLKLCAGGGDSYFGATVNSFIHVLMYSYYLCALLGIKVPRFIKSNLTKCQMLQFCVCAAHSIWCITTGHQTKLACLQLFVMVNMLILFGNFYMKSYGKKKKAKVQ